MSPTLLSAGFESLPTLPPRKLGPSGADSQVGGFVYVLGPCGSLQRTLLWDWSISCCLNPHTFFQSEVLKLYFPALEPWVAWPISFPSCSSWFICMWRWDCLLCQLPPCLPPSSSCHLATGPLHMATRVYPSLHLLLVCMNVSSLTPWLSDFHTVQFSGSSGCFCF